LETSIARVTAVRSNIEAAEYAQPVTSLKGVFWEFADPLQGRPILTQTPGGFKFELQR